MDQIEDQENYNQDLNNEDGQNQNELNEEFKIWKKNAPLLYDIMISTNLDWPSLTVQWLPNKDKQQNQTVHKLIFGTHTSDQENNYLMIGKIRLPNDDCSDDFFENQLKKEETKVSIETKILHDGEVNKARYMPQKYNVIATKTNSGEVHIFDYTQHPVQPKNDIVNPQIRLKGHEKEGFGLNWNALKEGHLLSGGQDGKICMWDIQQQENSNHEIFPYFIYEHKSGTIEDVSWHKFQQEIYGAVTDDCQFLLCDTRVSTPQNQMQAHNGDIYAIDFNPFNEYLFVTGSQDKTALLWDLRNLTRQMHTFEGHSEDILRVEWSPFNVSTFGTCSADRKIIIWDISKIGEEVKQVDFQDGPPEIFFTHCGHRARVSDFNWNLNDQYLFASVEEENNYLQIWKISENLYKEENIEQATQEFNNIMN